MEFRYCPEDNKTGADPRSRREELENIAQGLAEQLKQDKAKADQVEERVKKEGKRFPWRIVVMVAAMVLLGVYYFVWPPIWPPTPKPMTIGHPATWTGTLEDAVNALWKYREAIDLYRFRNQGKLPTSVQQLLTVAPELPPNCPGTGKPFAIKPDPEMVYRLEAPDPASLGVSALYLSGKSAPPIIVP